MKRFARNPRPMTANDDAGLGRHVRLFLLGLGGSFLPTWYAAWANAGTLLPVFSVSRAQLHLLPLTNRSDAVTISRADARWISVPRQAATDSEPRGKRSRYRGLPASGR